MTLYQLHSFGAAGAPAVNPDVDAVSPCGRGLRVLQGWLDHVAALGCDGVLLTPIFVSSTHGYDTVDPFRIAGTTIEGTITGPEGATPWKAIRIP